MTEKFEALFVDGPLDGQIKTCLHHQIQVPVYKDNLGPAKGDTFIKEPSWDVEEYYSHKFFVEGEIFYLMGPTKHTPTEVFRNLYYGYSDAVKKGKSHQAEIEKLETRLVRCHQKTYHLQEEVQKLKAEISDLLVGDKE